MAWSSRIPDIYKWLSERLTHCRIILIRKLRELCDETVDLIARAQQSDGYLDTTRQIKPVNGRIVSVSH